MGYKLRHIRSVEHNNSYWSPCVPPFNASHCLSTLDHRGGGAIQLQLEPLKNLNLVFFFLFLFLCLYCDFISDHMHRIHHSFQSLPYISNYCSPRFLPILLQSILHLYFFSSFHYEQFPCEFPKYQRF